MRNAPLIIGKMANEENVTAFCLCICFCRGMGLWCMDDHVCNVLYNVNTFLSKDDHDTF